MGKALLIDLDGVIRTWRVDPAVPAERAVGLPAGSIQKAAFSRDLLLPAITGQVSDPQWRRQIAARLQAEYPDVDAERAVQLWSSSSGEVNKEVAALVRECRHKSSVILISNATSRLPDDLRRLGIDDLFDHVINSSDIGYIKPQKEIFEAALRHVGATTTDPFFVDDKAEHVAAAEATGIAGHVFRDVASLRENLRHHGLI
ncbi:MAG: HAD-IA family hydrolase [Anaerolineales bacterium]|nr:HAD-IA family hydrolase [Anaerolineales bacterium]